MNDENVNLVVCVDSSFLNPLIVLLKTIRQSFNPDDLLSVYAIHSELREAEMNAIDIELESSGLRINWVNAASHPLLRHFISFNHISKSGWNRILVGSLLPPSVTRVLYLDCDLLICGSLAELWCSQFREGIILQAVQDAKIRTVQDLQSPIFTHYGVPPETDYFNSGVLLIDLTAWRGSGTERVLMDIVEHHAADCEWGDQCALNIALHGKWQPLPRKWNLQPSHVASTEEKDLDFESGAIVHFVGKIKPWHPECLHPLANRYRNLQDLAENTGTRSEWYKVPGEMMVEAARLLRLMLESGDGVSVFSKIRRFRGHLRRSTSHLPVWLRVCLLTAGTPAGLFWHLRRELSRSFNPTSCKPSHTVVNISR